jgi:hypothetical protein
VFSSEKYESLLERVFAMTHKVHPWKDEPVMYVDDA